MHILKRVSKNKPLVKPQYFTGKVVLKPITDTKTPPVTRVFDVKFHGGARTKLHSHTGGQILIGTQGSGSIVTYKRAKSSSSSKYAKITKVSRTSLSPGKVAFIPPKVLHTHGSVSKSKLFSHIAVNLASSSSEMVTSWFDSDLATWLVKMS